MIKPWLDEFDHVCRALGLSLHQIKGNQAAADDWTGGMCHFGGSWLLLAGRHPLAAEASRVWLTPGARHATVHEQGRALGYLGTQEPSDECCVIVYTAVDTVSARAGLLLLSPG